MSKNVQNIQVINFIVKAMENWREELVARGQTFAEIKIRKGIFQKDSSFSLLFVKSMMELNYILRNFKGIINSH